MNRIRKFGGGKIKKKKSPVMLEKWQGWRGEREALTQIFMGWEGEREEEKKSRRDGGAEGCQAQSWRIISSGYHRDNTLRLRCLLPSSRPIAPRGR